MSAPPQSEIATKLLKDYKNDPVAMWSIVVNRFAKAGLSEDEALIQAQVSRICRASDYNFETSTPCNSTVHFPFQ